MIPTRRRVLYGGTAAVLVAGGIGGYLRLSGKKLASVREELVQQEFREGIVTIRNGIVVAPSESAELVSTYEVYFRSIER